MCEKNKKMFGGRSRTFFDFFRADSAYWSSAVGSRMLMENLGLTACIRLYLKLG